MSTQNDHSRKIKRLFTKLSILTDKIIWDKILNKKSEALWVFLGQTGTALGVLLGVKILTHILNPFEFGRLALANTIVILIGINVFGPISQGLMRFWSISLERGEKEAFVSAARQLSRFLIYIVLLISLIFPILLTFTKWIDWMVLLTISLIVGAITGWYGIKISILTAARKRKFISIINTGNAFGKPIIASIFIILIASNTSWAMLGYLLTTIVAVYVLEQYYGKVVKSKEEPLAETIGDKKKCYRLVREILSFSWPFVIWGLFSWIHQSCDRWSLQAYHGTEVVGAFSVITYLALYPLIFGSGFLSTLFIPIAYERAGGLFSYQSVRSANKILFMMTGIYVLGALLLISFYSIYYQRLVLLISNTNYVRYSHLLPWLTASWAFFYLGQMVLGFGLLLNKPRIYILPILVSAVVAASSTFYLSSISGPAGVVCGLGIAGFVYALWCMTIAKRLFNSCAPKAPIQTFEKF